MLAKVISFSCKKIQFSSSFDVKITLMSKLIFDAGLLKTTLGLEQTQEFSIVENKYTI